jgi:hypothetical protein
MGPLRGASMKDGPLRGAHERGPLRGVHEAPMKKARCAGRGSGRRGRPHQSLSLVRSRAIDWLCSWQTRLSVTPSTAAISFRFMSCS